MTLRSTRIATLTGLLDLLDPHPDDITLKDIAQKLAQTFRWGKVLKVPLSVAQHSIMVANQLHAPARIYGLLHDAHEAFLGDITTPAEIALGTLLAPAGARLESMRPPFSATLGTLKSRLDTAIRTALGVPPPDLQIVAAVHEADLRMAATEWRCLLQATCGPSPIPAEPYKRFSAIRPLAWPQAEEEFTKYLERELAALGRAS